jgi:hypothetical protein
MVVIHIIFSFWANPLSVYASPLQISTTIFVQINNAANPPSACHPKIPFNLAGLRLGAVPVHSPAVGFVSWAFLPRQFFTRLQYQWLLLRSPAIEPIVITSLIAMLVLSALVLIVGIRFLVRPRRFSLNRKLPLKRREFSVQGIAIRMNKGWPQPNH